MQDWLGKHTQDHASDGEPEEMHTNIQRRHLVLFCVLHYLERVCQDMPHEETALCDVTKSTDTSFMMAIPLTGCVSLLHLLHIRVELKCQFTATQKNIWFFFPGGCKHGASFAFCITA